jgi:hypothetical protein
MAGGYREKDNKHNVNIREKLGIVYINIIHIFKNKLPEHLERMLLYHHKYKYRKYQRFSKKRWITINLCNRSRRRAYFGTVMMT